MSPARKAVFRCVAVCLGLSVFPAFELLCRVTGWGSSAPVNDAFTEFASVRPLFKATDDGTQFQVAADRREFFADESFAALKAPNERRILVFGGSTVQGRPYSIPTAFSTFLQIALRNADPNTKWEVINCGGISYASYRLLPIIQECVNYQPDLYIVCTGHNEFLECITYSDVRAASPAVVKGHGLLSRLNSFRFLQNAVAPQSVKRPRLDKPVLPAEVDAILDHHGGLNAYSRSALSEAAVVAGFRTNLRQMIDLSERASIPLLLLLPPSNLADCPPFKSEFRTATTPAIRRQIHRELNESGRLMVSDPSAAIDRAAHAVELDDRYAFSWYQHGRALLNAGQLEKAAESFTRARDEDVCPLRMTSALQRQLTEAVSESSDDLINLHQLLQSHCRDGIVGNAVLIDHVHPSFHGNQLIALHLLDVLAAKGFVSPPDDDVKSAIQKEFETHLTSLDNMYFLRGRRTLESLQAWTQGRADGPPLKLD